MEYLSTLALLTRLNDGAAVLSVSGILERLVNHDAHTGEVVLTAAEWKAVFKATLLTRAEKEYAAYHGAHTALKQWIVDLEKLSTEVPKRARGHKSPRARFLASIPVRKDQRGRDMPVDEDVLAARERCHGLVAQFEEARILAVDLLKPVLADLETVLEQRGPMTAELGAHQPSHVMRVMEAQPYRDSLAILYLPRDPEERHINLDALASSCWEGMRAADTRIVKRDPAVVAAERQAKVRAYVLARNEAAAAREAAKEARAAERLARREAIAKRKQEEREAAFAAGATLQASPTSRTVGAGGGAAAGGGTALPRVLSPGPSGSEPAVNAGNDHKDSDDDAISSSDDSTASREAAEAARLARKRRRQRARRKRRKAAQLRAEAAKVGPNYDARYKPHTYFPGYMSDSEMVFVPSRSSIAAAEEAAKMAAVKAAAAQALGLSASATAMAVGGGVRKVHRKRADSGSSGTGAGGSSSSSDEDGKGASSAAVDMETGSALMDSDLSDDAARGKSFASEEEDDRIVELIVQEIEAAGSDDEAADDLEETSTESSSSGSGGDSGGDGAGPQAGAAGGSVSGTSYTGSSMPGTRATTPGADAASSTSGGGKSRKASVGKGGKKDKSHKSSKKSLGKKTTKAEDKPGWGTDAALEAAAGKRGRRDSVVSRMGSVRGGSGRASAVGSAWVKTSVPSSVWRERAESGGIGGWAGRITRADSSSDGGPGGRRGSADSLATSALFASTNKGGYASRASAASAASDSTRTRTQRVRGSRRHMDGDGGGGKYDDSGPRVGHRRDQSGTSFAASGAGAPATKSKPFKWLGVREMEKRFREVMRERATKVCDKRIDAAAQWAREHQREAFNFLFKRTATFVFMDSVLDAYWLCMMSVVAQLALTDLFQLPEAFALALTRAQQIASHFIRMALPLFERALVFEPALSDENLLRVLPTYSRRFYHHVHRRTLIKMRALGAVLASCDVVMFPRSLDTHKNGVKTIEISNTDDNAIVTGSYDGLIRFWDLTTGECLGQLAGHASLVTVVALTSDDDRLVSASFDATIKVWNTGAALIIKTLTGHTDSILSGELNDDDDTFVSCSMDGSVRVWGIDEGLCYRVLYGHEPDSWVKDVCIFGDKCASVGLDRRIVVWSLASDATMPEKAWTGHSDHILDIDPSDDGKFIITTSKDRTIRVWDLTPTVPTKADMLSPLPSWAVSVDVDPDGKRIAAATFDNAILIYNIAKTTLIRQLRVHCAGAVKVIWTGNGKSLLLGTVDGKVLIIHL